MIRAQVSMELDFSIMISVECVRATVLVEVEHTLPIPVIAGAG
jgi:hypothetical protein